MTYTTILTEKRGRVGLVTLNRPEAMNALNRTLMRERWKFTTVNITTHMSRT